MQVFHAGTAADQDGQIVAAGGRVLSITAVGDSVAKAQQQAYQVTWSAATPVLVPVSAHGFQPPLTSETSCPGWQQTARSLPAAAIVHRTRAGLAYMASGMTVSIQGALKVLSADVDRLWTAYNGLRASADGT